MLIYTISYDDDEPRHAFDITLLIYCDATSLAFGAHDFITPTLHAIRRCRSDAGRDFGASASSQVIRRPVACGCHSMPNCQTFSLFTGELGEAAAFRRAIARDEPTGRRRRRRVSPDGRRFR